MLEFLVELVRPNRVLLTIPLALIEAQRRGREALLARPDAGLWVALAAPTVGLPLHSVYLQQLTGQWFAWGDVQSARGRTYEVTTGLSLAFSEIAEHGVVRYVDAEPITILNGLAAAMAVALLWPLTKTAGPSFAVFVFLNRAPAVASGGLMSVGRFISTLFRLFYALPISRGEQLRGGCVVGFRVLQVLLAVLFFTWRPPY